MNEISKPISSPSPANQALFEKMLRESGSGMSSQMAIPKRKKHGPDFSWGKCIHELFEAQAERTPDATAVVFEGRHLTYRELNVRANQLAHYLRKQGVGPEVLVGICVERSLEMVVGVFGILKAGGAYVPFDPSYPSERLAFMLQDCQARVLLTQEHLLSRIPDNADKVLCLERDWPAISGQPVENPVVALSSENLIYVIYTSGSTGKPKGCLNTHQALANRICWMQNAYQLNRSDRILQKTPFSFDVSAWEFFWPLTGGAAMVMARPGGHMDPGYLIDLIESQQISTLHFVPSMLSVFLEQDGVQLCRSLRRVFCSGEMLSYSLQQRFFASLPAAGLYNLYGPTETAIDVTHWTCLRQNRYAFVPIGQPVANTQIHILDDNLRLVPAGVAGELHIGGVQVGRGYLNRPELTAEKFIPDPFSSVPGTRLYKTGDLARYHPGGIIEYLGRIDDQVKVRGFRIEPGEMKSVLDGHPQVLASVVVAHAGKDYDQRLIAYLVCRPSRPAVSDLRDWLGRRLPDYMLPAVFIFLDRMPLTPNGKIDRHALPDPGLDRPALRETFVAPVTPKEKMLATIWSEVLQVQPVGIHDNYFELGGDSIRSIQILARAGQAGLPISLEQLFQNQTIHQLCRQCLSSAKLIRTDARQIQPLSMLSEQDRQRLPKDLEDAYPASRLQVGMLYHSELHPDTAVYHDIFSYRIEASLDQEKLRAAIRQLTFRHQILRTSFDLAQFSEPIQLVHGQDTVSITFEDISHLSPDAQDDAILAWIETEKACPFDYTRPPLIRFQAHLLDDNAFHLSHSQHHAILDGWSLAVMFAELLQIYGHLLQPDGPAPFFPEPVPYRNFVASEKEALQSEKFRHYWINKLEDHEVCRLPRWPGKPRLGGEGDLAVHHVPLSSEISAGLNKLANLTGVTVKSVFLAAHFRVLSLLSGRQNILTGLVTNGRPEEYNAERTLGLFLNTLPLRIQLTGGSWRQLVREVFEAEKEFLPFRRYPLSELQKEAGGQNLFEAPFAMVHFHVLNDAGKTGIGFREGPFFEVTNFPFFVFFIVDPHTGKTQLRFDLNAGEFCKAQIEEIAGYYTRILAAMASDPEERYESFSPLSENEQDRILCQWNNTQVDYPGACIHELFEEQAERTPDAIALVFHDQKVTYRELNAKANQLAHYLRKQGVGPEVLVGICVERSLEMIVGVLGILKAGGAYVPFDPTYPKERLGFMVEDAGTPVMLTQRHLLNVLPGHTAGIMCIDSDSMRITGESEKNPANETASDDLAYVMYTSGSTGKPKGVCVTHRGIMRLVKETDYINLTSEEVFLHLSSISFDASTFEIWGCLLKGAKLVVMPPGIPSLEYLGQAIVQYQITTLWLTAGLFHLMVDEQLEVFSHVRQLLAGGDVLSVSHVRRFIERHRNCRLVNGYGPTENTTFTCCHVVKEPERLEHSVPIGRPIANTRVYVLDSFLQPVPVGVAGELHAGGDGLARGYLNRPELTEEKFIPDPFSKKPGARLYKTGDIVRYLPDGNLEFLGRIDHQVKIRGYRIEPGEIEAVLIQFPSVRETVVVAEEDKQKNKRLVAYVALHRGSTISIKELRNFLKEKLPDYMVPTSFVLMDSLPLTPNGKIDRKALPEPDIERPDFEKAFVGPRTPFEELLVGIWCEVLGLKEVGIHDNFFELGGHSLLATQIISRLRNAFQVQLPLRSLFEYPTIAGLAIQIIQSRDEITDPDELALLLAELEGSASGSVSRFKEIEDETDE
jgi:amino acid adenylation domain-containing protein